MKLATRKSKDRDGELLVVSRDLQTAILTQGIAPNLQYALDHWSDVAPQLQKLSDELNAGKAKDTFAFEEEKMHSPLPRSYQWVDGSAYLNHVELVRKARGAEMPKEFLTDPLMYQGCSDSFLAPRDPILMESEEWGIDFESEVAVITDDVPMGVDAESALKHIRLIYLVNDVSLRNLIPQELGKGFGFLNSKPPSAFSPVAVTPDELGSSWKDGKLHLALRTDLNGKFFGKPNAGIDMQFNFGQLVAHAAKTRPLAAGTIVGSGTISNKDRSVGSSCLAEIRMLEIIESGKPSTPFMKFGDEVKIWMDDTAGKSIFGTIQQKVKKYERM
ncbi:MAG: fumarylacetoacetate hydrolase family protein [Oligoflexia bacterium]|nr:fumarylacetoacetate hydrolase family protein [Oligoflexia bacterium]